MKLIHLSDLHLGKRLNDWPRIDEQAEVLDTISGMIEAERPDAVLIAGDVYDRPMPSEEATRLLNAFLLRLNRLGLPVLMISGNHDSAERLAFAADILENSRLYISPAYDGSVRCVELNDSYGPARFYLLPFIKPTDVRRAFPEEAEGIVTYTDALAAAVAHMQPDPVVRNVLVAHQFVTGAQICDSEERSVGGLDDVSADVFDVFDYVALGHIHGPQSVGGMEKIRYSGTPLKYSVSERHHEKSVTVVEMGPKGSLSIRILPIPQPRDVGRVTGCFDDLLRGIPDTDEDSYLEIVLTDEDEIPDAAGRLKQRYGHILSVRYDNRRTRLQADQLLPDPAARKAEDPLAVFEALYTDQQGSGFSDEQRSYLTALIGRMKEAAE